MTFATGPLVWPLGHRKERALLRESTNFYGTYYVRRAGEKRNLTGHGKSAFGEDSKQTKKRATPRSNTRVQYPPYPPYLLSV